MKIDKKLIVGGLIVIGGILLDNLKECQRAEETSEMVKNEVEKQLSELNKETTEES